ncbi:EF-hand domain-containing family member C2 [Pelobates cultripes]|uniref:EF-hand domain-containing family member C2 n=1 Tax=Pelobates cultripes TaxID=61616 RepID=A0AAD1QYT8_PELCU|nr:EF-hand domain-containing family member C2 [Pelobates cultripes]
MALPLLPGNSFNRNLGKEKFHKSQHFGFSNDTSMLLGEEKPGIGGEPLLGQKPKPKFSVFPKGVGSNAPSWVAFDKQVLSFEAYFEEGVPLSREETRRIRHCKIYFYLEDDTIQVVEPQIKNSCLPQGTIIRRHRIPLPSPNDDQFYTVDDFNINMDIVFYSRIFTIVNCDEFTHNFLRKLGFRLNPPGSIPPDSYSTIRRKMKENLKPLRPYERTDTLKQFLEHDREVLRFYCFWDDTLSMFGDCRDLILHYFLADDTIEIIEIIPPNAGRDTVPVFLHRGKLPKDAPTKMYKPGEITSRTVLNVFGPMGRGGRYILDNLKTGAVHQEFYKDCDLAVGVALNAWGRNIILCDCDEFTKNYYRTKYGIEDFAPIQYKAAPPQKTERKLPPYNGFGSEEDSLCSCLGLLPKPPQRDFKKFMEKDRNGLESNVLRFVAKLATDNPIDKERKFIISYFLCDDSVSVFEPPQRNSGIDGGKFLERCRVKKPGQELFKSELSEYFKAEDLFVGARVKFNDHNFILVDADEYVFNYMEKNANEFPMADIIAIISKLRSIAEPRPREIKQLFAANDPGNSTEMAYETFRNILVDISDKQLTEHQIMTIGRYYSVREKPEIDLNSLLALAHEQLKKKAFENFNKLCDAFKYNDREKTGSLSFRKTITICKAFKIPLEDDLLRAILHKYEENGDQVNYLKFTSGLNWRENPTPARQITPIKYDAQWSGENTSNVVKRVNFMRFLDDLFGLREYCEEHFEGLGH